jgi:hypothetical protein
MKSLIAILIVSLNGLLPTQEVPVIERGKVGAVAIGSVAEAIYNEFGDRARLVDLKLEGQLSPALEIKLFGAQAAVSLVAEIWPSGNKLVVTRIRVLDPRLRTKDGIGVGSTYGDLRRHYSVDWVGPGEGDFIARVEALGISFLLDMSAEQAATTIRNPMRVPANARVVGMLITR